MQMCIYDAIFKQRAMKEQIPMNCKLIIHFMRLASAPAKILFCVKKTQPALKQGKPECDKMKIFIFEPMMPARKQSAVESVSHHS